MIMTQVPIACSLDASELVDRTNGFRALAAKHLVRSTRTPSGATLEFRESAGAVEAAVTELVRAEKACCPFFEFALTSQDGLVRLEIAAPPEAGAFVDGILEAMRVG
jgi:hypothetical protein